MSTVSVKCYLLPEHHHSNKTSELNGNVSEIRRFTLAKHNALLSSLAPPASADLYEELTAKIRTAFGEQLLAPVKSLKLYYQDDENELVGFTRAAELQYGIDLQEALHLSKGLSPFCFKVYVKSSESKKREATADGSSSSSSSSDSSDDEDKKPNKHQRHHHHGKRHQREPAIHQGVVCDGCSGSIAGVRYKCAICTDYDLCATCREQKNVHRDTEHKMHRIERPSNMWKAKHWKKYYGLSGLHPRGGPFGPAGGCGPRRGFGGQCPYKQFQRQEQPQQQQQQQQQQQAGGAEKQKNPFEQTLNDFLPYIANSVNIVNDPEQLKNIGEYLKSFLDPFGIDVSYYVDSKNKAAAAEKKEEAATESKMETNEQQQQPSQQETATATTSTTTTTAGSTSSSTLASSSLPHVHLEHAAAPATASASPFAMAAEALHKVIHQQQHAAAAAASAPVAANSAEQQRDKKESSVESEFNMVDIEKELRVIKSIEQMKLMGYSDDNGWLTRLVVSKEGNLNAVLDALSPMNINKMKTN